MTIQHRYWSQSGSYAENLKKNGISQESTDDLKKGVLLWDTPRILGKASIQARKGNIKEEIQKKEADTEIERWNYTGEEEIVFSQTEERRERKIKENQADTKKE